MHLCVCLNMFTCTLICVFLVCVCVCVCEREKTRLGVRSGTKSLDNDTNAMTTAPALPATDFLLGRPELEKVRGLRGGGCGVCLCWYWRQKRRRVFVCLDKSICVGDTVTVFVCA